MLFTYLGFLQVTLTSQLMKIFKDIFLFAFFRLSFQLLWEKVTFESVAFNDYESRILSVIPQIAAHYESSYL